MKKIILSILAVVISVWVINQTGCNFSTEDLKKVGAGFEGRVIPGPGQPGYDVELEEIMEQWFLQFSLFNSAAVKAAG